MNHLFCKTGSRSRTSLVCLVQCSAFALAVFVAAPLRALERLEPAEGCYFGVNLGADDTISRLTSRLGITPAVFVQFISFPLTPVSREQLNDFLNQVRRTHGLALITLEPFEGLDAVTETECLEIARLCETNEVQGIAGILIRFAHEMNGNWYPWCQQPLLFKQKFRLLSRIVHTNTTRTAMLWAPNNGIGYPFAADGAYQAVRGSADFAALDTNGDGQLTAHDDMYEPYYPGDDAVDWVGMTIYHWGADYPWLENEMPLANSFAGTLRGTANETPVPDFYARYCSDGVHNKPLAIPETAALFNTQQPAGPGEFLIKQAWWRQAFNASDDDTNVVNIAVEFPKLKCINWFDHYKPEAGAQGHWIDWRISENPVVCEAFVKHLQRQRHGRQYFLTAKELECRHPAHCIAAVNVPRFLPLAGAVTVSLITKTAVSCDLVVDLLDENFLWQGGTRASVATGTQVVTLSFIINSPLTDGQTYRWSIFLTSTGKDYLDALAWHGGPDPVAFDHKDRPRLNIARHGEDVILTWRSAPTRQYQVFERGDLVSDSWAPVGPLMSGDGAILQLLAPPTASPRNFYRLQAFPR